MAQGGAEPGRQPAPVPAQGLRRADPLWRLLGPGLGCGAHGAATLQACLLCILKLLALDC